MSSLQRPTQFPTSIRSHQSPLHSGSLFKCFHGRTKRARHGNGMLTLTQQSNHVTRQMMLSLSHCYESPALMGLETLLVKQYQPPVDCITIEFPTGLIGTGETPQDAVLQELREEMGFVGEKCKVVPQVSREVCMSPGLTDESFHCVLKEVNLDNPYNHGTPKGKLLDGEHVTVKQVDLKEGVKKMLDNGKGMPIMGLYLFALGLKLGASLQTER